MRNGRAAFLILLCLLSASLIAACGDDDENGTASPSEEFIADADQICQEAAEELVADPPPTATTAEEAVPVLQDSLDRRQEVLAALVDLGEPPSDIREEWNQVIEIANLRVELGVQLLEMAKQDVDPTSFRYADTVRKSGDLEDQRNRILKSIGSTACAEVLTPEEREEVIARVTEFETEALDDCTEYMTDEAIELLFGSLEECQRIQENPPPEGFTKKVEITSIEGIDEVSATVDASLQGGVADGQKVTYQVIYVDGVYKINAVTAQT
jgi:hypothetical protein